VKRTGIIGYGALGRQILDLLDLRRAGDVLFFDDPLHNQKGENSFPFDSFLDAQFSDCAFYIGLGYRHLSLKVEILTKLKGAGRNTPTFVHSSCQIHPSCRVGSGCVLYPMCNLGAEVEVAPGVLLNNSVVVSHNSRIGSGAYLSPGVVLSGNVTIGNAAFLGTGVVVANNRSIGAKACIGIGSVVTRDVPDGASAIGNPLRLLEHPLKLE
jgi:sugar O-acyltransferase (sialic acid O-acetyltransferase NeuD family)